MNLIRRSFLLLLAVCLGCVAQSASPELTQKIERQVRSYYKIPPEVHLLIGAPSPSPEFPNYESVIVTVDNGGKKQDLTFLVSKDHSSMMRLTKFDLSKDPFAETMSKIDTSGRPTRGAKASKVVVVNFDDFQCPFCSRMHQTLFPEILKEYGDRVTFIYKDFPLVEIHPWAMHAAVDANCLAKLEACVKTQDESVVKASMKQAESVGVEATPTLFISGEKMDGAQTIAEMRLALDRALKDANLPVPEHPAAPAPASK